jgi:DNA transformation protein and related proteins
MSCSSEQREIASRDMTEPVPLAKLGNLGPNSEQALMAAGITSLEQLRKLGSVTAYCKAKKAGGNVSLNLLWALEGALSDMH